VTAGSGGRIVLALSVAAAVGTADAVAQVVETELSTDTVSFGDRFELRVDVLVPAGAVVHVPEVAMETDASAGVASVRWTAERAPDGGSIVSLTYPVVAYRVGVVSLPPLTFFLGGATDARAPPGEDGPVRLLTAGDPGSPAPGLQPLRVPSRRVWVLSVLSGEDVESGLDPRPADDVLGRSWNAPAVASAAAFLSLLLGVVVVTGREWMVARGARTPHDLVAEARRRALEDLGRLLAQSSTAGSEEVAQVFERSSTIVRRYVECFDRAWTPALTSTELMHGLRAADEPGAAATLAEASVQDGAGQRSTEEPGIEVLRRQMAVAEVVKFGRFRPDLAAASDHVRTLRSWVEAS